MPVTPTTLDVPEKVYENKKALLTWTAMADAAGYLLEMSLDNDFPNEPVDGATWQNIEFPALSWGEMDAEDRTWGEFDALPTSFVVYRGPGIFVPGTGKGYTWADIERASRTWQEWEAFDFTWEEFENVEVAAQVSWEVNIPEGHQCVYFRVCSYGENNEKSGYKSSSRVPVLSVETYPVYCTAGEDFLLELDCRRVRNFKGGEFTIEFKPHLLHLMDVAYQTTDQKNLSPASPDIDTTQSRDGIVRLTCGRNIPTAEAWGGLITQLHFRGIHTEKTNINVIRENHGNERIL